MSEYTKFSHIATIGSTEAAMCGEKPPGREWKRAPEKHPECEECIRVYSAAMMAGQMYLAS